MSASTESLPGQYARTTDGKSERLFCTKSTLSVPRRIAKRKQPAHHNVSFYIKSMFSIMMNEKNQSNHPNDEGAHQAPSVHLGVADILIGISSKNDPPSSNNVAKRVRYDGSGSAKFEQIEDKMEAGSDSSSIGEGEDGTIAIPAVASMPRTRSPHQSSERRLAAAPVPASRDSTALAAAEKPISTAERHAFMAKRRQMALFRMQERRRVQNCREKAVMQMARNMLSPEQLKEMEEAVAKKKQRKQQEQHPPNGVTFPTVVEDTKESNPHGKQN